MNVFISPRKGKNDIVSKNVGNDGDATFCPSVSKFLLVDTTVVPPPLQAVLTNDLCGIKQ